jgi:hypothetical protein
MGCSGTPEVGDSLLRTPEAAWKATAPVPSIRKSLRKRRAARVLAKLGIE